MPPYRDRADRIEVSFPVVFVLDGERIEGTCQNLSQSGLLAKFTTPLEIWTDGEVDLLFGTNLLGVKVRVARVSGLEAGLAFRDVDEHQRAEIRDLIAAAQKVGPLPGHLITTDG